MLAFIAALPDARLDQAQRSHDRISAADLYREILDYWLKGEVKRQSFVHGRKVLPEGERLAACRALALRLWTATDPDGDGLGAEELTQATAARLTELEKLGFSDEQAAHAVGSGSLLTRGNRGFGFVHRSVLEWLVADTAASDIEAGNEPAALAAREMSDLMTDFFCDLAGHAAAQRWADWTLHPSVLSGAGVARRANATRVGARLRRRTGGPPAVADRIDAWPDATGPEQAEPLNLRGQDLRDQDIAAFALPGGSGRG